MRTTLSIFLLLVAIALYNIKYFTKPHSMTNSYKKIILFGDSQFEGSWNTTLDFCFPAALAQLYSRRADVLNRGLSGYSSKWMQTQLTRTITELVRTDNAAFLFILWLGTNDSCLWEPHHVALDAFKSTATSYIDDILHNFPSAHILLVNPAPISKTKLETSTMRTKGHDRTQEQTKIYADAFIALATNYPSDSVRSADLYSAMISAAGPDVEPINDANLKIGQFTLEGLHLNGRGYNALFDLIRTTIMNWPSVNPENLPRLEPNWQDKADSLRVKS
ncbi:SGNH hydrolase-type esterase domain-containing protein [Lipomyces arxii]|uniref:SGNH hydrolase-type esterase domain-containing protein n=1 Tax=Lipomyces arxii TaxID=56418 RepID=UPI0034CDDFDE